MLVNCPDNLGQRMAVFTVILLRIIYCLWTFLLRQLSNSKSTGDVAGTVAEVPAEGMGEVSDRRKAAPGSDVGHGCSLPGGRGTGQHRVGEVQAAGQDVPRD